MMTPLREQPMEVLAGFGPPLGDLGRAILGQGAGRVSRAAGVSVNPGADRGSGATIGAGARTAWPWHQTQRRFGAGQHPIDDPHHQLPYQIRAAMHLTPASRCAALQRRSLLRETFVETRERSQGRMQHPCGGANDFPGNGCCASAGGRGKICAEESLRSVRVCAISLAPRPPAVSLAPAR